MTGCANVNTPSARAMERVFQNVAMVDVMRTFYKDHRMLQWVLEVACGAAVGDAGGSTVRERR